LVLKCGFSKARFLESVICLPIVVLVKARDRMLENAGMIVVVVETAVEEVIVVVVIGMVVGVVAVAIAVLETMKVQDN
jgi:hypothetical protein